MPLTAAQLEQFEREGYTVAESVFSPAELEPIKGAIAAIIDGEAARLQAEGTLDETFSDEPFETRLSCILRHNFEAGQAIVKTIQGRAGGGFTGPELFAMIVHRPLLDCIAQLVGPEIIGSSVYRIRPKLPQWAMGEVPWHQDSGYFSAHCDTDLIVTCWIPLVDATIANGCLYVQPGSHRGGIRRHFTRQAGYLVIPDDELPQIEDLPVEMAAGDVLLLTNLTTHCSRENRTDVVRWSIDLRYQGAAVPTNAGQTPEAFEPGVPIDALACYPPEADFVVRCPSDPSREVRSPEQFHAIRKSYDEADWLPYPERGWTPVEERGGA